MDPRLIPFFLANFVRLSRHDRWTAEQFRAYQQRELARLRAFAIAKSPYYREAFRGLDRAPHEALPSLARSTLLERFDDIVTDRRITLADVERHVRSARPDSLYLGRYRVMTSTGSSGGRVSLILSAPREWAFDLASSARSRSWAGKAWRPWRRVRTAYVVATLEWFATVKVAKSYKSWFAPQLILDANWPMAEIVRQLNAYRPEVLTGYSTVVAALADEQLAGRLDIAPELTGTGGEVTTPEIRRRIAAAWGDEPFDNYGTSEGGSIASECRVGRRMHLFEDSTVVEVVDDQNRPVPAGEWGAKLLVTPLWPRTQPLIRFEITDEVRVATDPCPCGRQSRTLDGIRGRRASVWVLPAANGMGTVTVNSMAFGLRFVELPATWRTFDMVDGSFVVRFAGLPPDTDTRPLVASIRSEFEARGAVVPPIEVLILPEIPRGTGGKASVTAPR